MQQQKTQDKHILFLRLNFDFSIGSEFIFSWSEATKSQRQTPSVRIPAK
jgi:hypothetical protein